VLANTNSRNNIKIPPVLSQKDSRKLCFIFKKFFYLFIAKALSGKYALFQGEKGNN